VTHQVVNDSPYARVGAKLVDQGYSAIPCRPGSKVPGICTPFGAWKNQTDWPQFCERLPVAAETEKWSTWPDAGVCIALGGEHGLVAVDIDSDDPAIVDAIEAALGDLSFVQKAGRKGRTLFYRAGPAVVSTAFNVNGERVLDLLCKGKQTVVPPTIHKDTGRPYTWLSGSLEHVAPESLPMLPDDIAERLAEALKPFGCEAPVERSQPVGESDGTWREINDTALANLDAWVPHLGIDAKRHGSSWRAQAQWRNGDGMNVSFHPKGIKDYGDGDRGMSAIDVTMAALDMDFGDAVDWLKGKLGIKDLPRLHLEFRKPGEARPVEEETASEAPDAPHLTDDPFTAMARAYVRDRLAGREAHHKVAGDVPHRPFTDEDDPRERFALRQVYRKNLPKALQFIARQVKRAALLLSAWVKREIPPRDYILGNVLCTTSRWLIYGETGVGKTLVGMDMAAAAAAGSGFLNWPGSGIRRRVMYLDGELPAETFKERMQLVAERYGPDVELYGYNRDVLEDGEMPPLNTPEGEKWLLSEIESVRPDVVVFDSIMCLLTGSMAEEESWEPVKAMARKISKKRIAQIWLHHTGHDTSKAFGTKTREWEMDTVVSLTKDAQNDEHILMEFKKARLRTPKTREQFEPLKIACNDGGWTIIGSGTKAKGDGEKPASKRESMRREFCSAYHQLANDVEPTRGLDGKPVSKVKVEAIRDLLKKRGHLDVDDDGALTPKGRTAFKDAKASLIGTGKDQSFIQDGDLIWLLYPDRPFTFKKSHDKTKAGARLTALEEKALTALATAISTKGLSVAVGVNEEEGYPAGIAFVMRDQWRDEFEADDRCCDDDGPNAFERTVAALIEKELVKNGGDHVWLLPAAGVAMNWKKK